MDKFISYTLILTGVAGGMETFFDDLLMGGAFIAIGFAVAWASKYRKLQRKIL